MDRETSMESSSPKSSSPPPELRNILDRMRCISHLVTPSETKPGFVNLHIRWETTSDPEEQALRTQAIDQLHLKYSLPIGTLSRICDCCGSKMPFDQMENVITCFVCDTNFDLCDMCIHQGHLTLVCPEGFGCQRNDHDDHVNNDLFIQPENTGPTTENK